MAKEKNNKTSISFIVDSVSLIIGKANSGIQEMGVLDISLHIYAYKNNTKCVVIKLNQANIMKGREF